MTGDEKGRVVLWSCASSTCSFTPLASVPAAHGHVPSRTASDSASDAVSVFSAQFLSPTVFLTGSSRNVELRVWRISSGDGNLWNLDLLQTLQFAQLQSSAAQSSLNRVAVCEHASCVFVTDIKKQTLFVVHYDVEAYQKDGKG